MKIHKVMCVENPEFPQFEGHHVFGGASKAECEAFVDGFKWWRGGCGDDGEHIELKVVEAGEEVFG
jgi:hypothetical protein